MRQRFALRGGRSAPSSSSTRHRAGSSPCASLARSPSLASACTCLPADEFSLAFSSINIRPRALGVHFTLGYGITYSCFVFGALGMSPAWDEPRAFCFIFIYEAFSSYLAPARRPTRTSRRTFAPSFSHSRRRTGPSSCTRRLYFVDARASSRFPSSSSSTTSHSAPGRYTFALCRA